MHAPRCERPRIPVNRLYASILMFRFDRHFALKSSRCRLHLKLLHLIPDPLRFHPQTPNRMTCLTCFFDASDTLQGIAPWALGEGSLES